MTFCSLSKLSDRLQNRTYSAFYSFYTVCTGAHLIAQPCHNLHKQKVKLATWAMMFSVIQKKKKINVCETIFFIFSFILTNDITVQLLVVWSLEGGRVAKPGNSPHQLPPLSKLKNCQVQNPQNNMVRLHKVLLPFYSNSVLFYQHYKALLYVYFLFFS